MIFYRLKIGIYLLKGSEKILKSKQVYYKLNQKISLDENQLLHLEENSKDRIGMYMLNKSEFYLQAYN